MRRPAQRLSLAMLLIAGIAGCGGDTDEHADQLLPPLDVQQVTAQTTDFQRELLRDGELTFAEYEQAVLAALVCMEDAGLDVEGPFPRDGDERFIDFRYGGEAQAGEDAESHAGRVNEIGFACMQEYLTDVSRIWESQHLLTPEERELQRGHVIQCLRDGGLEVAVDASIEEVLRTAGEHVEDAAVAKCREDYPDFFVVGVQ
jgi:hypothetical protein